MRIETYVSALRKAEYKRGYIRIKHQKRLDRQANNFANKIVKMYQDRVDMLEHVNKFLINKVGF